MNEQKVVESIDSANADSMRENFKDLALQCGFTVKPGLSDLKEYVFDVLPVLNPEVSRSLG